jgi:hypothetical protein
VPSENFSRPLNFAKSGFGKLYCRLRQLVQGASAWLGEAQENLKGVYDFWKNPKMYAPGN